MNSNAKKIGQVVVGFGLLFATALAFQNCSGYQVAELEEKDQASACVSNCPSTAISILLTNSRISLMDANLPANNRVFDVGGYCDPGGYTNNEIEYQFVDGSTPVTTWESKGVRCNDLGRFHIPANVPAAPAAGTKTYTLQVRLKVLGGPQPYYAHGSFPVDVTK